MCWSLQAELGADSAPTVAVFRRRLPLVWRQRGSPRSPRAVRYQLSVAGSFAGKSGCAVKLFCSSARGIAVNPLHHKSDSSFLSTEIQLLSSRPLKCCVGALECRDFRLWQESRGHRGDPKTPPCFTDLWAPFSLIHLCLIPHGGRVIPPNTT